MLHEKSNDDKEGKIMSYRLKGHESFILRDGWITKALLALSEPDGSKLFQTNSGTDSLGVGTNMAKAIRYWLRTSGITRDAGGSGVFLTDLGKTLLKNDPYIEDDFSLYVIHSNIVKNYELATSWNVFFNEFELSTFTRSEMIDAMTALLIDSIGDTKLPERSIRDDVAAILAMYASDDDENADPEEKKISPFAHLGLVTKNGAIYETKTTSANVLDPLLVLYIMADTLNTEGSLLIDDIVYGANMPGKILHLSRVSTNELLDKLADKGYITVNRTAGLDIVYSNGDIKKEELLSQHYNK